MNQLFLKGQFISAPKSVLTNEVIKNPLVGFPASLFRKGFCIDADIAYATLYITSLGIYYAEINGSPVSDDYFNPGWTDYHKRVQVQQYEVSELLKKGKNAIGAAVSDGWYSGCVFNLGRRQYGETNALWAALEIRYIDGSANTLFTDSSWKVSTGAVRYADLQQGEYYDSRMEMEGWATDSYCDSKWSNAEMIANAAAYRLVPQIGEPVRKMGELTPIRKSRTKKGKWIYDMGQNMVGVEKVTFTGNPGEAAVIRFGEMLNSDGTLYTENLRSAAQADTLILNGTTQTYSPKFTFHGFRYIEIDREPDAISAFVLYSACKQTGFIQTGSTLVNQLFSNQLWGQRGNFISIPTDCPQRDERSGWTGDAQIFAKSGCYNLYARDFYRKFMDDVLDAQRDNGAVTDIAPYVLNDKGKPVIGYGNAAWADVIFVIPWTLYTMYGDVETLKHCYSSMCRHMEFLRGIERDGISDLAAYGDWLNINDETDHGVLGTAYYAYDAFLMSRIAKVLGKSEDASFYSREFLRIKAAFSAAFVLEDGKIVSDTQCAYALALAFDLTQDRQRTADHLVRRIEENGNHLSTGFIGVKFLLPVLSDMGRADLAYSLLLNETYPSWGYSIKNGATTIWERWNSYTAEHGFGDKGMNSFNHYSLGSCAEWMYEYMGGITPLAAGFEKVRIAPVTDERVGYANVQYESVRGRIGVVWDTAKRLLEVTIPENVQATVITPGGKCFEKVQEGLHVFEF